jgi:hypothetical protein
MGDLGLGRSAKLADRILDDPVRVSYALVLPEVLDPGSEHEGLQKPSPLGGILEQIPGVGAVPPAPTQIPDGDQEGGPFLRIDAVLDRQQHPSTIGIRVDRQDRRGPVHRGREIHARSGLELPAPGQCGSEESAGGEAAILVL